ncbi:ECF RNA polymerase sigma factor SigK [Agromyces atrinae]|uniref:RNA polymerase sigma-70 factor (ECF subfamily) n=1 Tax=Agromyces atrinae TaxID=592376 RepID=A0A4Q2M616_9MICO|nr:ECF RNA polymerase sigma factor SigK [Agromyces atrinae]NYD66761.1 RNA polymerase sigma-70 factor (ECF subfamily) [Agromyces atrinae]RXZ87419.1 sigma-70 family RNA polymerase sigma factor [Agromyces atrinae]
MLELVSRETDHDVPVRAPIEILLQRVAGGDQAAFSELYDQVAARIFGLVRRLLIDQSQAEEVTQEVFLEIWQTAPRFAAEKGSALSWLFTLAHRRAVDRIRSAQASRVRDMTIGIRDLEAPIDSVSEAAEIKVEHERVQRALGELTDMQRQAISLAYYGGLTQSEIATQLSVPLGTVKTRIRDGMIRLRDALGVTA